MAYLFLFHSLIMTFTVSGSLLVLFCLYCMCLCFIVTSILIILYFSLSVIWLRPYLYIRLSVFFIYKMSKKVFQLNIKLPLVYTILMLLKPVNIISLILMLLNLP